MRSNLMKRFPAAFALTALAAATVALAQQAPPPAEPPASAAPQEQSPNATPVPSDPNAAADPNASTNSEDRRQALMKDCVTQVAAANPGVPAKDINNFCDKEVNQLSQPQPQN
jgi:hypothetical protein